MLSDTELYERLKDRLQLRDGFQYSQSAPIVLPLTLTQYKQAFIDDDAPFFLSTVNEDIGGHCLYYDPEWSTPEMSDPKDTRVAYDGVAVLKKR